VLENESVVDATVVTESVWVALAAIVVLKSVV